MKFKVHKRNTARRQKRTENVKHHRFDAASSASSPTPFAEFAKKKDLRANQMSGIITKKSKDKSFKLNNKKELTLQSAIEHVDETDPILRGKDRKKLMKSKMPSQSKIQTESIAKMGNFSNQQLLDGENVMFKWSKAHKNSKKLLEVADKIAHDASSVKQMKAMRKQKFKSKDINSSKRQIYKPPFPKQQTDKGACRTSQDEINIPNKLISGNEKEKKLKSGLQRITGKGKIINSMPGLDVQNVCEESQQHKKLKKSKEIQTNKFNTYSSVPSVKGENVTCSSKVNPSAISKATKHENHTTSYLSKKRKMKHSFSENSDVLFHDAGGSLSDGINPKKFTTDVLEQCEKEHKKNLKNPMILSNKQLIVGKAKERIFKKKKVLQKFGMHQGNYCMSEGKNKDTKVNILMNKAILSDGTRISDENVKCQGKKKKRKEESFSEKTCVISDDTKESYDEFNNRKKKFRFDYGTSENIKQKKRRKRNFENSFDDIMHDTSGDVTRSVFKANKSGTSTEIFRNTPTVECEDKSHVKIGPTGFIQLPKKELRGFEGREDTPERLGRTVFVGNLPLSVNKKVLQMLFQNIGKIESVRLRSAVPVKSSIPKRVALIKKEFHSESNSLNGYVVFKKSEDAEKALALNKTVVEGHHIRVDIFKNSNVYDNKCSVFVGNLPYNVSDESLWEVFGECGSIEAVRVVRDPTTGMGKGFGFVLFEKKDSVESALSLNEAEINGRKIRVKIVEKGNRLKDRSPEKSQNNNLKVKKRSVQKLGWRISGQKKTKKKLIKKKKDVQNKKRVASILSH